MTLYANMSIDYYAKLTALKFYEIKIIWDFNIYTDKHIKHRQKREKNGKHN